jgi:hypothetical protein
MPTRLLPGTLRRDAVGEIAGLPVYGGLPLRSAESFDHSQDAITSQKLEMQTPARRERFLVHKDVEYTAKKFQNLGREVQSWL